MAKRKRLGRKELKELAINARKRRQQMENLRQMKAAQQRDSSLQSVQAPTLDAAGAGQVGPPDPRAGGPMVGKSGPDIREIMLKHIKEKYPEAYKDAVTQGRKAAEAAQRMQAQQQDQQQPMTGDIDAMMGQQQPGGGQGMRLAPQQFIGQQQPQQQSPYPMMGGSR